MNYDKYLKSEHWNKKRQQFFRRSKKNRKCYVCSSTDNLNVHHNSYDNLHKEPLVELVCLFQKHHSLTHDVSKQLKVSYRTAIKLIRIGHKINSSDYSKIYADNELGKYNPPLKKKKSFTKDYVQAYLKQRASYYPKHPAICNCEECKGK